MKEMRTSFITKLFFVITPILFALGFLLKASPANAQANCTSVCTGNWIITCNTFCFPGQNPSSGSCDQLCSEVCTAWTEYCACPGCQTWDSVNRVCFDDSSKCPVGQICSAGACTGGGGGGGGSCPGCRSFNGSTCVDDNTKCPIGQICSSATCITNPCSGCQTWNGSFCFNDDTKCSLGKVCSAGTCINPCTGCQTWNGTACVNDNNNCPSPQVCSSGTCVSPGTCNGCQTWNGSTCVDDNSKCPVGQICSAGTCVPPGSCTSCQTWNGSVCVDDNTKCPAGQVCSNGICTGTASITGIVFVDTNNNGVQDAAETGYQGATVSLSKSLTRTTNAQGQYSFLSLATGSNYTVTLSPPSGYQVTTANPVTVFLGPSTAVNFGTSALPPTCLNLVSVPSQAVVGETTTLSANGCQNVTTYSWPIPDCGTTLNINAPTTTYTAPGTPNTCHPSVQVCNVLNSCTTYSTTVTVISGLPWFETESGDVRYNNLINTVPQGKYASADTSKPSLFFSSNSSANFTPGSSSQKGWKVDDEYSYNSKAQGSLGSSSYSFYKSRAAQRGLEVKNLADALPTSCAGMHCTLSNVSGLDTGIYEVNGDLTIGKFTHHPGTHVIILVSGTTTINDNIQVQQNQNNLFILASKGNITVDRSVGNNNHSLDGVNQTNIDGVITSEGSITIDGYGTGSCASRPTGDNRLNVGGILIANALSPFASGGTGKLVNNRSLCGDDAKYPTLKVYTRADFLFQLTDFYKLDTFQWREVQP